MARTKKSFPPELLEELRVMPVVAALDALGLYWKHDPDFVPVKDKSTVRLNVALGGGGVELLAKSRKVERQEGRKGRGHPAGPRGGRALQAAADSDERLITPCIIIRIRVILLLFLPSQQESPTMSQIPAEIRDRITAVANELFEDAGREAFPTVDAVRRAARADMNTTSAVMREWRRAQTAQAVPVAVAVPETITQANAVALAALWQQAQELANESLQAAQAAWETERVELDAMRAELADAYESQATELDEVRAGLERANAATDQVHAELATTRAELSQAVMRAERAEAKADEIERRANDLRAELDRAHADADQARATLAEQQKTSDKYFVELGKARDEAAQVSAKNRQLDADLAGAVARQKDVTRELEAGRAELLEAKQQASELREEVARLNGATATYKEMLERFEVAAKAATRARKQPKAEG